MSIFDKFKKIFSANGSNDVLNQNQVPLEEAENLTDNTNVQKELEEREQKEFQYSFSWVDFYKKLFTEDAEIKDLVNELSEVYKNPIDAQDVLNTLNIVTNAILEKIPESGKNEYGSDSLLKKEIASALIKACKDGFDVSAFVSEINPNLNNLYTFSTFIKLFIEFYRRYPSNMKTFITELLVDPDEFIEDTFEITMLFNYFYMTPYSNVSSQKKKEFLNKINDFVQKYSENDFLNRLFLVVRQARYQLQNAKSNSGVVQG